MKKKILFSFFALSFFAMITASIMMMGVSVIPSGNDETVDYKGIVNVYITRADGSIEDLGTSDNILYNEGKNMTQLALGVGGTAAITNITFCNANSSAGCGVPVAGASETYNLLADCGFSASGGTYSDIATQQGNYSVYITATSTCDDVQINMSRLQNASGSNFAGNNFTLATLQTDDQLTVNWSTIEIK